MSRKCPVCHGSSGKKDRYCKRCGAPLANLCTNDGGPFGDPCQRENEPDAAYCTACGEETLFSKTGILTGRFSRQAARIEDDAELRHFDHKFFSSP